MVVARRGQLEVASARGNDCLRHFWSRLGRVGIKDPTSRTCCQLIQEETERQNETFVLEYIDQELGHFSK